MTTAIRQVAFIDSRITDHQTVLAELAREAEWFVLDADEDGIEQMARILAGYRKLDAIQVFSHGSPGTLYLGSTVLNSGNLADYESRFAAVGTSLTETGDILLYGCNVAQGDHGLQFINSLAQATGADVAASTDLTGSAVLGGNWALEASAGTIEAETQIDLPPAVGSAATQQTASISINGNGSADVGHRASSDVEAFSLAFAGTIAADGIWRTGNLISAGAIEWFAITLQESGLYNFYAEETGFIGGIDPQIRIADSGGNTVNNLLAIPSGANAIFGNTELLGVSGLSGTFYVEIRDIDFDGAGFFDSANDTGPYRIRVDTVADDAGSTAATASTALNADGSWLSKTINTPNDVDWFKLTLDATNLYTFRVEETGSIGGLDPQLRIVDSAGNTVNGLLAVPDGLNTPLGNAELVGVSGLSGTYYLEIRDIDYDGAGILDDANDAGPYRVSAETIADDAGSTAATASTALSINGPSLSRAINTPNDLDWFKVTLDAGNLYTFRVEETTAGIGGIDPQIRLVDVSGNAIDGLVAAPAGVDTPFGNTELTFVSTVTGIYYVEVRDADFDGPSSAALFDDAEDTGTYQITATSMKEPAGPLSSSATLLGSDKYYTTFGTFAKAAYHLSTVTLANGKKAYVEKLHSDQILPADYVDTAPGVGIHGSGDNFVKAYANAAWESIAPTGPKAPTDWKILTPDNLGGRSGWNPDFYQVGADVFPWPSLNKWFLESDGIYVCANAAAFAAVCDDALIISFRGTNDNDDEASPNGSSPDERNWFNMSGHWEELQPFVHLVDTYTSHFGISKVYVTGHSLGGAMALAYMSEHQGGNGITYEAVTFAAPGYQVFDDSGLDNWQNVIRVEVDGDPVPDLKDQDYGYVVTADVAGLVHLDTRDRYPDLGDVFEWHQFAEYHSMDLYLAVAKAFDAELPKDNGLLHGFDRTFFSRGGGADNYLEVALRGQEALPPLPFPEETSTWEKDPNDDQAKRIAPQFKLMQGSDTLSEKPTNAGTTDYFLGGPKDDTLGGTFIFSASAKGVLIGGDGDDLYLVDNAADQVVERAGQGTDTVRASVSHVLQENVENLILEINSSFLWFDARIDGVGNDAANVITGNNAANRLEGKGGNDTLSGNRGNDTLDGGLGTNTLDGGDGVDTAMFSDSRASYVITPLANGYRVVGAGVIDTLSNVEYMQFADQTIVTATGLVNSAPTGSLAVSDTTPTEDQLLSITDSLADADGLGGRSYQWQSSGNGGTLWRNINGATGTSFAPRDAEVGRLLRVQATYTDGRGKFETVQSDSTAAVANVNDLPTGGVTIAGNAIAGETLMASNMLSDADGIGPIAYRWHADGLAISGATGNAFSLTASQLGKVITVVAGYTDGHGTAESVPSAATAVVGSVGLGETWTGTAADDTHVGTGHGDRLDGLAGNDTLNGGAGADIMIGGDGRDYYYVDDAGDIVSETNADPASGGNDLVYSYLYSYTLPANVERLRLFTPGSSFATGNSLDNTLYAGDGNNVLDGDTGNDSVSYAYATSGINVSLALGHAQATGGSGADTLIRIDNLIGSNFNDNLHGNNAGNELDGAAGHDTLNGSGGADTLIGGDGTDYYYVDDAGDVVIETNANLASGGNDLVYSYLYSYTLTDNVERLRLLTTGSSFATGNGLDNILYAGDGNNVMNGAAGNDTVSYAYAASAVSVNLALGNAQATGGSGIDTLQSIENLAGSNFNDWLRGNGGNNVLEGNDGNDSLNGEAGADTLIGGDGTDYYYVDDAGDVVIETNANLGTGGNDLVYSYLYSYTLTDNVERLRLLTPGSSFATGNGLDNILYAGDGNNVMNGAGGNDTVSYAYANSAVNVNLGVGNAQATGGSGIDTLKNIENLTGSNFNDWLRGDGGNNVLEGGDGNDSLNGEAGADTLIGGDGTDYYYVDDAGDVVVETNANLGTGGNDLVYSYLYSYTLTDNVERLRLLTPGSSFATGNSLDNTLYAGDGNNVMNGAAGNDTVSYAYATSAVSVNLALGNAQTTGGSGIDTLQNVENLAGSSFNDNLRGNNDANRLDGAAGNDTLNGSAGADTMSGGDGTDYYYIDDAGDVVVETNASLATGGNDLVYSYIYSYTLTDNVERLRVLTPGSSFATGNSLDNILYAGDGNNVMNGGAGNDTVSYAYATSAVDVTLALTKAQATGGSGTDTLKSIENLAGSNFNDRLTGNDAANELAGGSGNDTLNGGLGNDTLSGGAGSDTIRFDTLLNALTNRDTITDFNVVADTIELENAIFASLTSTGTLAAGSFHAGAGVSAADADDYILYDSASGALFYDADGNGVGTAVPFATLGGGLALSSSDFMVT